MIPRRPGSSAGCAASEAYPVKIIVPGLYIAAGVIFKIACSYTKYDEKKKIHSKNWKIHNHPLNTYHAAAGVSRRQDQNVTNLVKKCQHSGIWLLHLESL